jgi:hypothetical protein
VCFDIMKNMNNEPKKPGRSNGVVEYWNDGRVPCAGRGGWVVRKWTGFSHLETAFSHLFPHNSTQVVDFPHLAMVSIFCEGENSPQRYSVEAMGSPPGRVPCSTRIYAEQSADCYGLLRESPRKFAQIRPVNPRLFGFLQGRIFFSHGWTLMNTDGNKMEYWSDELAGGMGKDGFNRQTHTI